MKIICVTRHRIETLLLQESENRPMEQLSDLDDYIPVDSFYSGKSVFVTGGTGFLGKLLIEKLLWSCHGIENIYILIRPKKGDGVNSRLANLLRSPVFDRLRKSRPTDINKIIPIAGDISHPFLGISENDQKTLLGTVSVVFHAAATVKFDQPIKEAIAVNLGGTKCLIELCNKMPHLQTFVHISTAYSNCDRREVKEEIYDPQHDPVKIIKLMELIDDDIANDITSNLLGDHPNTYTLAKALAEKLLQKETMKVPIVIVRPSIVLSSLKEPVPGWLDSWTGPTPVIAAAHKGIIRFTLGDCRAIIDLIPADFVVNLAICAAWRAATVTKKSTLEIYNCCSGYRNPITLGEINDYINKSYRKNPYEGGVLPPKITFHSHRRMYEAQKLLTEKLPAHIFDSFNGIIGRKKRAIPDYKKLVKARNIIEYFCMRQWTFVDDNVKILNSLLRENDKQIFIFDVENINWHSYLENYVLGIRTYLLKDTPDSLSSSYKQFPLK